MELKTLIPLKWVGWDRTGQGRTDGRDLQQPSSAPTALSRVESSFSPPITFKSLLHLHIEVWSKIIRVIQKQQVVVDILLLYIMTIELALSLCPVPL